MKAKEVWTSPTRRAFVQMLGLGAAALAVKKTKQADAKPTAAPRPTIWIGHC